MIQGLKHKTYTEFYNLHDKFNENKQYGGVGKEGMKKMFTYDNHLENIQMLKNLALQFDQLSQNDQDLYMKELEQNELENRQLIHVLKHAWIFKERPRMKDLIQMIPNQVMNKHRQHPHVKHSEKPIFHSDYELSSEFEILLEEMEKQYLTEETQNLVHKMNREEVFSEHEINKKINNMAGLKNPEEEKNHTKFIYHDDNYKTRKLQFIKDEHRNQFNELISKYFSSIASKNNHKQEMSDKKIEYHEHFYNKTQQQRKIQDMDLTETDEDTYKFISNSLNELNHSISNQVQLDENHLLLINHVNKHLQIHSDPNNLHQNNHFKNDFNVNSNDMNENSNVMNKNLNGMNKNSNQINENDSFIEMQSKSEKHGLKLIKMFQKIKTKNKRDESQFNDNPKDEEEECDNKELDALGQELTIKIAAFEKQKAEKLAKSLAKIKPGPAANKDIFMISKKKNDQKMVILMVIAMITAFFRVCVPPIILAFKSCAEAAVLPMNLMHLFNFEAKTSQIQKQCIGWPTFFLELPLEPEIHADEMIYYECAQAYMCITCSTIWPMCNIIPFIVTNAPIVTIPFLFFLPLLDWLALLPGKLFNQDKKGAPEKSIFNSSLYFYFYKFYMQFLWDKNFIDNSNFVKIYINIFNEFENEVSLIKTK